MNTNRVTRGERKRREGNGKTENGIQNQMRQLEDKMRVHYDS